MSDVEEISVPQMIGFDKIVKIIVAYLKVGAGDQPTSYSQAATMAKVSLDNVRRNAKYLEYIGMLQGERGNYKLTEKGRGYAQALDWGRLSEANSILKEMLKDNDLAKTVVDFVDMHQPVTRDDLVSQIALISRKPNESRFVTGINGFVEMLVTSGLLEIDSSGNLTVSKEKKKEELIKASVSAPQEEVPISPKPTSSLPIALNINIDDKTDIEKLKEILKAVKEIMQSG
jgi:predicted transcriptional regulator